MKDADNLFLDAEGKIDLRLLSRSNDFRKHAICKRNKIDDLDKLTGNFVLRRESIIWDGFFLKCDML